MVGDDDDALLTPDFAAEPPADPHEAYRRGSDAYQAGDFAKAAELFTQVAHSGQAHANIYWDLAQCYLHLGDAAGLYTAVDAYLALTGESADPLAFKMYYFASKGILPPA